MSWFKDLWFQTETIPHAILMVVLVCAIGLALGNLRIRGVGLGIGGVLFVGLAFGHWGWSANSEVLHFLREFGLILFVFTIGIQVGPGFFASLKRNGLPLNVAAAAIVLLGVGLTVVQWSYVMGGRKSDLPAAVGLLSGATTNTPSMAAATAAFADLKQSVSSGSVRATSLPASGLDSSTNFLSSDELVATTLPSGTAADPFSHAASDIGAAYAIAYPFGIFGVLLAMILVKLLCRIDIHQEQRKLSEKMAHPALDAINLEVINPALSGKKISQIPTLRDRGVVVTRLMRDGRVQVASKDTSLQVGDVLTAVGPTQDLAELELIIGQRTSQDARTVSSGIDVRRILVSNKHTVGKTIDELALGDKYGVKVTRVLRSGFELPVTPFTRLQFGDRVVVVGETASLPQVVHELGDSPKALDKPLLVPILIGIALGVILGSVPIVIPGLPVPLKLGLAGGPLIVAIVLSRVYRIGPLIWYMPNGANMMLREIGIILFLASVGLLSGEHFMTTLQSKGLQWILIGAVITFVPVLVVGLLARILFRINYLTLVGLLSGSMTDPPALAFAQSITGSDAPTVSYATVYPLVMLLRVLSVQVLVILLASPVS
ncbi:MAG: putative transport protein YidE [Phycisphaerae bacterium]|jgi:putative transport protein|nr:MAG: putative transport protein YidE [Phycisphaerae bacterium]